MFWDTKGPRSASVSNNTALVRGYNDWEDHVNGGRNAGQRSEVALGFAGVLQGRLSRRNHPAQQQKPQSEVDVYGDLVDCHRCAEHQHHQFLDLIPLHFGICLDLSSAGAKPQHQKRSPPFLILTGYGHTMCWYVELASDRALLAVIERCKIRSRTDRRDLR